MTALEIIAHCGACDTYVDNSCEALADAVAQGADWIELDLRRTADGHAVVIHDATTYRMFGGGGPLSALTLAQVQALRGPSGERIATLDEALELPVPIIHEPKEPGLEQELAVKLKTRPQDIVSSFDLDVLDRLRDIAPEIRRGFLWLGDDWVSVLRRAAASGAWSVHPSNYDVCPEMVEMAKDVGLKLHVWSVGDARRAEQLRGWGVDGIMTYTPAATRAAISAAGQGD